MNIFDLLSQAAPSRGAMIPYRDQPGAQRPVGGQDPLAFLLPALSMPTSVDPKEARRRKLNQFLIAMGNQLMAGAVHDFGNVGPAFAAGSAAMQSEKDAISAEEQHMAALRRDKINELTALNELGYELGTRRPREQAKFDMDMDISAAQLSAMEDEKLYAKNRDIQAALAAERAEEIHEMRIEEFGLNKQVTQAQLANARAQAEISRRAADDAEVRAEAIANFDNILSQEEQTNPAMAPYAETLRGIRDTLGPEAAFNAMTSIQEGLLSTRITIAEHKVRGEFLGEALADSPLGGDVAKTMERLVVAGIEPNTAINAATAIVGYTRQGAGDLLSEENKKALLDSVEESVVKSEEGPGWEVHIGTAEVTNRRRFPTKLAARQFSLEQHLGTDVKEVPTDSGGVRYEIPLPDGGGMVGVAAIGPDGRLLAPELPDPRKLPYAEAALKHANPDGPGIGKMSWAKEVLNAAEANGVPRHVAMQVARTVQQVYSFHVGPGQMDPDDAAAAARAEMLKLFREANTPTQVPMHGYTGMGAPVGDTHWTRMF